MERDQASKFMFDLPALKGHISIGSSIVFSRLADSAGRFTENLVFGRMFGPATLGAYTFSNQVSRFVCEAADGKHRAQRPRRMTRK